MRGRSRHEIAVAAEQINRPSVQTRLTRIVSAIGIQIVVLLTVDGAQQRTIFKTVDRTRDKGIPRLPYSLLSILQQRLKQIRNGLANTVWIHGSHDRSLLKK